MANSTITLFLSTSLHEEKRFAIEHIDQWLLGFTATEVKKFQYIKNQLNLSIKINMSQDGLEATSTNDIDYVSITNSNETKVYYYFVVNKIWKSTETIEFVLKMDTLNTFEFDVDYSVDKKTLVRREHKDRMKIGSQKICNTRDITEDEREGLIGYLVDGDPASSLSEDYSVLLNIENLMKTYGDTARFKIVGDTDFNDHDYSSLQLEVYDLEGNIVDEIFDVEFIQFNQAGVQQVQVEDSGGIQYTYYPYYNYVFIIYLHYELDYDHFVFDETGTPPATYPEPENVLYFLMNKIFKGFTSFIKRIVDKYPENINPVLFKKEENYLLDQDQNNNWYLIYANENAPISSPSDTESKYVNPVKLMFARDTSYSISANTASPKTIYPTEFPILNMQGEQLNVISASYDTGAYIEVSGSRYYLSNTRDGTQWNAARVCKQYDKDNFFKYVYIYKLDSTGRVAEYLLIRNVSSVIFYGVANGWVYGWDITAPANFPYNPPKAFGSIFMINSNAQLTSYQSAIFNDLDLTTQELIKIIQLPYAPLEFLNGINEITSFPEELSWNSVYNFLEIIPDKRIDFMWNINFGEYSPFKDLWITDINISSKIKQARNDRLESKFFNSEFTLPKFVYDQFSFSFQLELIDINEFFNIEYENFYVEFGVSKRLSSKMYFKFNQYVCNEYERQDYNDILLCDRNNEIPLYTNAYINYMRTGYQFDVANKNNQQVSKWAGIALSTVGAIASFVSSPATGAVGIAGGIGLTTSTIGQVIGAIASQNQQENAIAQKILQSSYQSESVQGSDDVELFKQYGQNKAKLVKYQPSEVMSKMIKDLFYYGGYATSEYKVPDIDTRVYFNYLQCDLVLNDTKNLPEPILEDIINKFKEGATIFHKFNGEWDIEQQYENYEVSI